MDDHYLWFCALWIFSYSFKSPDIILHIPTEVSGVGVYENNFAVWALKREATKKGAIEDFKKLDKMFRDLSYPVGFFININ